MWIAHTLSSSRKLPGSSATEQLEKNEKRMDRFLLVLSRTALWRKTGKQLGTDQRKTCKKLGRWTSEKHVKNDQRGQPVSRATKYNC